MPDFETIEAKAKRMRMDIVEMIAEAGSGHPGGSLSAADIVATLYFGGIMRHDPANPEWPARDRFILSKGHAAPVLYAALAEAGYFGRDHLKTLRKLGSMLQGHPDSKKTPGVEVSTGSLGQGLSVALGMGLAARLDAAAWRTYVVLGDGEIQEGQIWEAAMYASYHKVDNVVAIVDYNKIQLDGFVKDIMDLEPLADKWRAFGWQVREIDGHNMAEVVDALDAVPFHADRPSALIAHTVKGKGVSFAEDTYVWHSNNVNDDIYARALAELGMP